MIINKELIISLVAHLYSIKNIIAKLNLYVRYLAF